MSNRVKLTVFIGFIMILVLGACTGESGPATAPIELPPTEVPPIEESTTVPEPSLVPVSLSGPEAGSEMAWMDGSILSFVPAGEFTMGSGSAEAPKKTVFLGDYWIFQTKVTNSMYAFCVAVGACAAPAQELGTPLYDNSIYANYPVVGVSWDMAANYCSWVGDGLPSEAQWEKAARGASGGQFPWGNANPDCNQGNFAGCVDTLTDVTKYAEGASPYGLLDMAGNAFEWVNDYYSENYYNSAPFENPTGPSSGEFRVVRGSGFETEFDQVTSAIRRPAGNAYHNRDLGFRCVIQDPLPIAPMCQLPSYIPSAVVSSGECQSPLVEVGASYCEFNRAYTSVDLQDGASYEVLTDGYTCDDAVIDGQRRLTCKGPDGTTGEVTVCNSACSISPDVTGASPVCDSGYGLDPSSSSCLYSPVSAEPGVAGCPAGYVLIDRGEQSSCVSGLGADGLCPDGTYFDSQYGACASPSAGELAPYGLNAPDLAAQTYQGCLAGFSYSPEFQCCQPSLGGVYPGCPLGTRFDNDSQTCIPDQLRLSGPGCVTVKINMLQCNEPFQIAICKKIKTESGCIKNQVYSCSWNEGAGGCKYEK